MRRRSPSPTRLVRWLPTVALLGLACHVGAPVGDPRRSAPVGADVDSTDPTLRRAEGLLYLREAPFSGRLVERYADDSTKSVTPYVAGRRHGLARAWHASGQPMYERGYLEGLEEGFHRGWWEDGRLHFEYPYADGTLDGNARER